VVLFHNGRGSQECIFDDAKNDAALNVNHSRRLAENQIFTVCEKMTHNLSREEQMRAASYDKQAIPKRPATRPFEKLATLLLHVIQRAVRFTRLQGKLTLAMHANRQFEYIY
jgi:hypothetical protein